MAVSMLPEHARAVAGLPDAEQGRPVDVAEEPTRGVVDPAEALHAAAGVGRNVAWEETGKEDWCGLSVSGGGDLVRRNFTTRAFRVAQVKLIKFDKLYNKIYQIL
jgi:hypothetical protein